MSIEKSEQDLITKEIETDSAIIQEPLKVKSSLSGSVSEEFTNSLSTQALMATPRVSQADSKAIEKIKTSTKAVLSGINPQDEIEGMLAAQMLAMHNAAMECFSYAALLGSSEPARKGEYLNQSNKLCRSYIGAMESLKRYRSKDAEQKLVVGRVDVHDGGQAIVGNVTSNSSKNNP